MTADARLPDLVAFPSSEFFETLNLFRFEAGVIRAASVVFRPGICGHKAKFQFAKLDFCLFSIAARHE